jgi:hypothetical protein
MTTSFSDGVALTSATYLYIRPWRPDAHPINTCVKRRKEDV